MIDVKALTDVSYDVFSDTEKTVGSDGYSVRCVTCIVRVCLPHNPVRGVDKTFVQYQFPNILGTSLGSLIPLDMLLCSLFL